MNHAPVYAACVFASLTMMSSGDSKKSGPDRRGRTCCPIVELRQYTLRPGQRDSMIDIFDRELVEPQEALGMKIIGQFRDLDRPNRFVWLRGFSGMPARADGLKAFYSGPVWKAHREAVNATIDDSDNVLLLRPARPDSGFGSEKGGLVIATLYYFDAAVDVAFLDFFDHSVEPLLAENGASITARFVTESSANNFPALPVREGENVFVWFSLFPDPAAYDRHLANLAGSPRWNGEISKALARRLKRTPEVLRLSPTARSEIHG